MFRAVRHLSPLMVDIFPFVNDFIPAFVADRGYEVYRTETVMTLGALEAALQPNTMPEDPALLEPGSCYFPCLSEGLFRAITGS